MLFNYVTVIPNCVPLQLVNHFLQLKDSETSPALVGKSHDQKPNLDYRNTNWISLPLELVQNTVSAISSLYNNKLINTYKQPIKFIEPVQFLYYNTGGKYDVHNDSEEFVNNELVRVQERDITILIYLNDDYEGGELELTDWGVTFKPKPGTLISFPSYYEFSHRVHPVTKGKRYNLVSWICTEDRIYPKIINNDFI